MALSPADFYAYSRATGNPVPESPEERAQLAPQVLEFRRNQLKAPESQKQQGFDPVSVGVGLGLALAGGGAALLGARRLLKGPPKSATAGVRQVNLAEMEPVVRRAAVPTEPVPSQPAPTRDVVSDIIEKYRPDYEQAKRLETGRSTQAEMRRQALQVQGLERQVDEVLNEIRSTGATGFNPRSYLESTGALEPTQTLTEFKQAQEPLIIDQKINAVESGEDQMTGRTKQMLQRNEDYDGTQIEVLEEIAEQNRILAMEQDEPIDIVAAQLPDGVPVDQVETARPLSSQELADIAKNEMIALRQEVTSRGLRPGTQRFERALAQAWTDKSISGAAPGTQKFKELQAQGKIDVSLPTTVRKAVEAASAGADPLGLLKERTLINIGPEAQIESTSAGTAIRGASPSLQEVPPKEELRQLYGTKEFLVPGAPSEMGPDIPGKLRVRGAMPADLPTSAQSKQEIQYSSLNRPPEPEVPGGAAGIGVYGIESGYVPGAMSKATGEYSAAAGRKPTDVPKWILKQEQTPFSTVSSAGLEAALGKSTKSGSLAIQRELERRQKTKESIAVSEVLRRARIEGRDPQEFLRNFGGGI
jgi:hypothetical protein